MAAKKKKPNEKDTGISGSTRSMRDEAEKEIARSPKSSPELAGQTPEELIHELRVHQIELEMQAEELRRAHLALEESRDKYLDLYEFAPVGYLTLTDKGIITNANLTSATLLGVARSTLLRAPLSKFIAEKDADQWHRYFANVRKQDAKQTCTLTLNRGDGSVFPARLESIRVPVTSDRAATVRVSISDMTDIRMAEEALRESEVKYRTLFGNMIEGFAYCRMIYDSEGRPDDFIYLHVNQAFDRITGTKTVTMKRVTEVYPGIRETYPELFEVYGRVALTGTPESFEIEFKTIEKWLHISVYSPEKEHFVAVFEDITERKRAEEELRESKALVDAVVESIPLMIFLKEAKDLRFVIFNRAGEELLGYDRTALLGKNNLDLFPPEQAAHFMAKDREVLDGELNLLDIPEESILTAKKGVRLLHTRKVCIRGADGTTKYLLGISEDITDKKHAERMLQDIIFKNPMSIQIVDKDGFTLAVNPAHTHLFGSVPPSDFSIFNDSQLKEQGFGEIIERIKNGEVVNFPDTHYNAHDSLPDTPDVPVWVRAVVFPLMDTSGKLDRYVFMHENITERKKAEEALRETNEYLHKLIDFANAPIIVWDPDFRITRFNHAFEQLTGKKEQEVIGQPLDILFPKKTRAATRALIKKTLTGERWETVEIPILASDGTIRTVLWNSANILSADAELISTIAHGVDITGRKQAENLLALTSRKLALMNDVTYQFIQNKITGLRGYTELSKDVKTEAERLSYIEKEEQILADIHHLIKDTREYQDIGSLHLQWIPVEQSIRIAVSRISPKEGISIDSALPGLELYSDPLLEKIFSNLIENAVKHGKTTTRIVFSSKETPEGLILTCEDDGAGISPEIKESLFDRRVSQNIRFGLFFVKECLLLSGMKITETGKPGKGARFEITVPKGMWRMKGVNQ